MEAVAESDRRRLWGVARGDALGSVSRDLLSQQSLFGSRNVAIDEMADEEERRAPLSRYRNMQVVISFVMLGVTQICDGATENRRRRCLTRPEEFGQGSGRNQPFGFGLLGEFR